MGIIYFIFSFILFIILFGIVMTPIIIFIIILATPRNNGEQSKTDNSLSNYTTKGYVMTRTELIFYRKLKEITDELNLSIFSQVNLERIIQVKDNNNVDRNKIKSRSIDYTIVNNKNCGIIACIELDDYSHKRENIKRRDEFINQLFKQVNIPLYRIEVKYEYNMYEIKELIKQAMKLQDSII